MSMGESSKDECSVTAACHDALRRGTCGTPRQPTMLVSWAVHSSRYGS